MLKAEVVKTLADIDISANDSILEIPPKEEYGDVSFPCFELAKAEKRSPQEIAEDIARKIKISKHPLLFKVEVRGGYVNFFFYWEKVSEVILRKIFIEKENFGKPLIQKQKIMVEHTSTNPNKALHIGHARNACLGDSLYRLLKFSGNDMIVANYIDDSGAQLADIIVGLKFLRMSSRTKKKFDHYVGNEVYVKVNKMYENNSELQEKKSFVLQEIERGNNPIAEFAEKIVDRVLTEQLKTAWRLKIFYNLLNKETDILKLKLWENAFETLKNKDLVYLCQEEDRRNCWLLRLSNLPEFANLTNPDITLVRSDGTTLYVAKDIAYAMWKHGLLATDFNYAKFTLQPNKEVVWSTTSKKAAKKHPNFRNVNKSINVIDVRQSYEQDAVSAALKLISKKSKQYIHYDYELVSLSSKTAKQLGLDIEKDFIHMSGRSGLFVNTDVVLDALHKKAFDEAKKRNTKVNKRILKKIAESIATSALRYQLLKVSPEKMIVFDIDEAIKLQGDTSAYLQYAYTRATSILRKAKRKLFSYKIQKINQHEKNLVRKLLIFPEVLQNSVNDFKINYICNYAYELAAIFDKFYEFCPVVKAENAATRNFRLALVESTRNVLKICFDFIGIEPLEKM